MNCPGCGSSQWNETKCPSCGRLGTDITPRSLAKMNYVRITRDPGSLLAVAAACVYIVACVLPVTARVNMSSGQQHGSQPGIIALLWGWTTYSSPLLFVAWLSNFPWFVSLVGRLAWGSTRRVRCFAVGSLACAVPAFLPGIADVYFNGYPARYWWFTSYLLLAVACWVRW